MTAILSIDHLSVEYYRREGAVHAVRDLSLTVEAGVTLAIVGESGCGKSTVALAIMGLILPAEGRTTGGSISFNGTQLLSQSAAGWQELRGKEIAMIFQDPYTTFNPVMTIGSQIAEAIMAHTPGMSEREAGRRAGEALAEARLTDTARIFAAYPHQLSGGQLQRCAIAMAIANKPHLLIADEPTTALDVTIQREIMDLLDTLKKEHHLTIIFITHNLPLAHERCQRVAVMYAGEIVELAATDRIFTAPRHPYTQALVSAVPGSRGGTKTRTVLPGQPPDLAVLPAGCPFFPRCSQSVDQCRLFHPELYDVEHGQVRCVLYRKGEDA